jgi:hypothetical protein
MVGSLLHRVRLAIRSPCKRDLDLHHYGDASLRHFCLFTCISFRLYLFPLTAGSPLVNFYSSILRTSAERGGVPGGLRFTFSERHQPRHGRLHFLLSDAFPSPQFVNGHWGKQSHQGPILWFGPGGGGAWSWRSASCWAGSMNWFGFGLAQGLMAFGAYARALGGVYDERFVWLCRIQGWVGMTNESTDMRPCQYLGQTTSGLSSHPGDLYQRPADVDAPRRDSMQN